MNTNIKILTVATAALTLGACASMPGLYGGYGSNDYGRPYPNSASIYSPRNTQSVQRVRLGTVIAVQPVAIDAPTSHAALGTAVGAGVGGLLGHQIGGGSGKTLATIAGAVGGAFAGNTIAGHGYKQQGLQITVALDNHGGTIAVTQNADVEIRVGERVEVIGNGYESPARVEPIGSAQ